MLAILAVALLAQVGGYGNGGNPRGPQGVGRYGTIGNKPLFAAFRSTGKGLPADNLNLCDSLSSAEKSAGEYWCINGGTQSPDSTIPMTKADAGFEEVTIKQCTGAQNCYTTVGLRHTTTQAGGAKPFFKSDILSGRNTSSASSFTACAWTRSSYYEKQLLTLGDESSTGAWRYVLGMTDARNYHARIASTTCSSSQSYNNVGTYTAQPWTSETDKDGMPMLLCVRYNGTQGTLRTGFGTPAAVTVGAHCAGGSNARYLYGGLTTVSSDGFSTIDDTYMFGGFHVSTFLSDARLNEISAHIFGNTIKSEGGTTMTNSRSTVSYCEDPTGNDGVFVPAGVSCITNGGVYKRRESRNYWGQSEWIGSGSGHGAVGVTVNDFTQMSPAKLRFATEITMNTSSGSYIWRPYYSSACPVGASVLSFYVKGISSSGSIRAGHGHMGGSIDSCSAPCAYTTSGWTRCKFPVTTYSDHVIHIGQFSGGGTGCGATGMSTTVGQKVSVWGIQCEADIGGALATPLILNQKGSTYSTSTADKPQFIVNSTATAPIALKASWISPPTSISLGDFVNNTGFNTYLIALSNSGTLRNFLRFLGYTAEYGDGSSTPLTVASDLTAETGTVSFRGYTTSGFVSGMTMGSESNLDVTGTGSAQTWNTVELGWTGTSLNFDGVIKNVCIDKKPNNCK